MSALARPDYILPFRERIFADALPIAQWPGHWYLAHAKPSKERSLAIELAGKGIRYFLPSQTTERRYEHANGRIECRSFDELLWPGYLFFCGTDDDRHAAGKSRFRNSIDDIKNQSRLIAQLEPFHRAIINRIRIGQSCHLHKGQRVKISAGHPLYGSCGTVDSTGPRSTRLGQATEVFLNLSILGSSCPVLVDERFIEAI